MANDIHYFHAHAYPRRLFVVKGKDKGKLVQGAFTTRDGGELVVGDAEERLAGATWKKVILKDKGWLGVLVWIVQDYSPASLAHEAVHVTNAIFEELGVDTDYDHDEHYAYMVQWVTDCLWQVVTGKFKDD